MIQTVAKHWRFPVFLAILDLLLVGPWPVGQDRLALPGRVRRLTETVWTVRLVAGCEMDYHTSIRTVALACPGVDSMRVWPPPVVQPWQSTSDPVEGWMAERKGAVLGQWTELGSLGARSPLAHSQNRKSSLANSGGARWISML